ncbi:MAG: hydrogenase iron-sulfur subunit, partial [Gammaproteobacteria bacterium]|nr:hydrogenase iron-sulfur subunit [Gammaproteobacteria bacterium]
LDVLPIFVDSMARNFLAGNMSDRFFTLMALIHLLGLPIMLIFALWIHVKRLTKVEIVVPRGLATGTFIALLILSFVYPAVSHKPADLNITPAVLHLDWFYLGIYPLLDYWTPAETWTLTTGITLLLMIMPWLPPKRMEPAAKVSLSHCNGCAQCFDDCPFHAISMQARTDGARWLQEAAVNPDWCAACGICVSSCPYSNPSRHADTTLTTGIDMPHYPVHQLRDDTDAALVKLNKEPGKILVYSCDHSADPAELNDPDLVTISLPCTGMLPASFITYALKKGADGVLVLGCRCGDCYYRFGNRWMNERLSHARKPFLPARTNSLRVGIYGAAETDMEKLRQEIAEFRNALRNGEQPACSPVQAATKQEQQRCGRG